MSKIVFPKDFMFGCATSAYQIEGAEFEDGRSECVWGHFARNSGKVRDNATGEVACEHYYRYKEDVAIMKQIGIDVYRFSISWGRVLPEGFGQINQRGIDFYSRLVDELLENNIIPFPTLFHWDMPYSLYENGGGWLNRDSAKYFADYASVMFETLGDRVPYWLTHNEPRNIHGYFGYHLGTHAPGLEGTLQNELYACHNMLLAHGMAVSAYRASSANGEIGITLALDYRERVSEKEEDIKAEKDAQDFNLFWYIDSIYKGEYPSLVNREGIYENMPEGFEKDYKEISEPIDFLGINFYRTALIEYSDEPPLYFRQAKEKPNTEYSPLGWPVTPDGIYKVLKAVTERVGQIPIYITENGFADMNSMGKEKLIHDEARIYFLKRYLAQAKKAMDEGVNLKGYFAWSLFDNYEWAEGYEPRFGLVYVDYETQERTLKDSAKWWKEVCTTKEIILD